MLLPPLLVGFVLLGPPGCGPSPATTGGAIETDDAGLPAPEPQASASVTMDQIVADLPLLCPAFTCANTSEERLSELAETLADIQSSIAAVSGRLDLIQESQSQQQMVLTDQPKKLGMMEQSQTDTADRVQGKEQVSSRLDAIEQSQSQIFSRLDGIIQSQNESASQLDVIQKTLDRLEGLQEVQNEIVGRLDAVQRAQNDLASALSARFDAIEASQGNLSVRLDTIIQLLQQQAAATSSPGDVQQAEPPTDSPTDVQEKETTTPSNTTAVLSQIAPTPSNTTDVQEEETATIKNMTDVQEEETTAARSLAKTQQILDDMQKLVVQMEKQQLENTTSSPTDVKQNLDAVQKLIIQLQQLQQQLQQQHDATTNNPTDVQETTKIAEEVSDPTLENTSSRGPKGPRAQNRKVKCFRRLRLWLLGWLG